MSRIVELCLGDSVREQISRDNDPVCQCTDVCIRDYDLGCQLDTKGLVNRDRYALSLPLRPEPEIVRVSPFSLSYLTTGFRPG